MPHYEFLCEKCQKLFELTMTISEHEKGKVRCPTCKSTRVAAQFGQLYNADDEEELTVLLRRFLEAGNPRTACEEYLSAQEQTAKTGG